MIGGEAFGLTPVAAPGICMPHMPSAVSPVLASAMRACVAVSVFKQYGCCFVAAPSLLLH